MNIILNTTNIITFFTALAMIGSVLHYLHKAAKRIEEAVKRIEIHSEDNKMTMRCNFVCLDGLTQIGANSSVTKMREEMKEYLINRGVVKDG